MDIRVSRTDVTTTPNFIVQKPAKKPDYLQPDWNPELGQRINFDNWHHNDFVPVVVFDIPVVEDDSKPLLLR